MRLPLDEAKIRAFSVVSIVEGAMEMEDPFGVGPDGLAWMHMGGEGGTLVLGNLEGVEHNAPYWCDRHGMYDMRPDQAEWAALVRICQGNELAAWRGLASEEADDPRCPGCHPALDPAPKKRGGARQGAGRKATGRARPVKQIVMLSEAELAMILPACQGTETVPALMRRLALAEADRLGVRPPAEPDEHPFDF